MATKTIFLAGGTFWGTEDYLEEIPGVLGTELGITDTGNDIVQGNCWTDMPSSYSLGTEQVIKVVYDDSVIPLGLLIDAFFETIDPFSTEKQINYDGNVPEATIYFEDEDDENIIVKKIAELQNQYDKPITVRVLLLNGFTSAGEYAEDYVLRNASESFGMRDDAAEIFVAEHQGEFGK